MSLIRLLTTTRSLSDVKNEPSPYRMTEQGLLPKFGPRKKQAEAARGEDAVRRNASPHLQNVAEEKENLGEGHGDRTDAGCSLKSESSRKPKGLRWWQKLFARKPRREKREPVQAEFSLDLVRVVRNDLQEAEATAGKSQKVARLGQDALPEKPEEESVFGVSRG